MEPSRVLRQTGASPCWRRKLTCVNLRIPSQMERLVRKTEYGAAKKFISQLRAKNDPPPQCIPPPVKFMGAQKQRCVQNAVDYCTENIEYEPIKGFKLWVLPKFADKSEPYIALVHVVVRHKQSGKYIDVTPPDGGDEGQNMIFIPSSRIYPDWTASEIADYCRNNLEIRMGGICTGEALAFKQMSASDRLYKATPEELKLIMCPKISSMWRHLFDTGLEMPDMPAYDLKSTAMQMFLAVLQREGGTLVKERETFYCIVDASKYRHLYAQTLKAAEEA